MRHFIIWFVTSFIIYGCSHKTAPLTSSMHTEDLHHKWKVLMLKDISNLSDSIYLDLRDINHSGLALGCNYFPFTPHYWYNNRMQLWNTFDASFSCDNNNAAAVIPVLKSISYFSVSENKLTLKGSDASVLLEAEWAADDERGSLARKWMIAEMINADKEQLLKNNAAIDLTDMSNASAYFGCNKFSLKVVADHTFNISVRGGGSTKMFCKDVDVNESVFSKVLPLINKYQVIGNTINLYDKDDVLLIKGIARLK